MQLSMCQFKACRWKEPLTLIADHHYQCCFGPSPGSPPAAKEASPAGCCCPYQSRMLNQCVLRTQSFRPTVAARSPICIRKTSAAPRPHVVALATNSTDSERSIDATTTRVSIYGICVRVIASSQRCWQHCGVRHVTCLTTTKPMSWLHVGGPLSIWRR